MPTYVRWLTIVQQRFMQLMLTSKLRSKNCNTARNILNTEECEFMRTFEED